MPARLYIIGTRFGRLLAISEGTPATNSKSITLRRSICLCDCGAIVEVRNDNLQRGNTKSCGCLNRELARKRFLKHCPKRPKMKPHPLRSVWSGMMQRCNNPNAPGYRYYGGRGIKVCDRWQTFKNFADDMGVRPYGMTIDRIVNDGNYEPMNCRWATRKTQQRNTRRTNVVTFHGKDVTVAELSETFGISRNLVNGRLREGWSIEDAITRPLRLYK